MARDRASRPEAKPLRLFVAVDVPEGVRKELAGSVGPLRETFPRARWTPPNNWHLTLKFLGRTWPRLRGWVEENVALVARTEGGFETSLQGLGVFPSERRARVLWAGLEDPGERFAAIAGALDGTLSKEFAPEKRPFSPHLTVARFDPPVGVNPRLLPIVASERFPVERLVLYRSHLRRPAPVYEPLASFALEGRLSD